jgi:hypothetical protein
MATKMHKSRNGVQRRITLAFSSGDLRVFARESVSRQGAKRAKQSHENAQETQERTPSNTLVHPFLAIFASLRESPFRAKQGRENTQESQNGMN